MPIDAGKNWIIFHLEGYFYLMPSMRIMAHGGLLISLQDIFGASSLYKPVY